MPALRSLASRTVVALATLVCSACARAGSSPLDTLEVDAGMNPEPTEPPMCDLSQEDLNPCDVCTRTSCCGELQDCAASEQCAGSVDNEGQPIGGEFGALQECVLQAAADSANDEASVTTCAQMLDLAMEAQELTDCILEAPGVDADSGANATCAASCFGVTAQ